MILLGAAQAATAAPTIFWSNYSDSSIGSADVAGGSGTNLVFGGEGVSGPFGTSADPASGKVFWANYGGEIYSGNLDGTGEACLITDDEVSSPYGVTYDPVNERLYWGNDGGDEIRYIPVPDTCPTGELPPSQLLYTASDFTNPPYSANPMRDPVSPAIDPDNNRIYWANYSDGTVGYADLERDVSSAGIITLGGENCDDNAYSVAVDPPEGRLYRVGNEVSAASLDGSNCVMTDESSYGYGLSRDAQSLFLGAYQADEIKTLPLGLFPNDVGALDTGGASTAGASYPVVVDVPTGTATIEPATAEVEAELTCSAAWSVGVPGMQWYRSPSSATSYSWSKDGQPVAGATIATLKADSAGDYTCTATASNFAGSGTSTATVRVAEAPGPGPEPTPSGKPNLRLSIRTPKKAKAGKAFGLTVRTSNVAGTAATRSASARSATTAKQVKTCAKLPKGLFVVERDGGKVKGQTICWTRSSLAAGRSVTYKPTIRSSKTRSGSARVTGTASATNDSGASVNASGSGRIRIIEQKAPKPKPPTG